MAYEHKTVRLPKKLVQAAAIVAKRKNREDATGGLVTVGSVIRDFAVAGWEQHKHEQTKRRGLVGSGRLGGVRGPGRTEATKESRGGNRLAE